MEGIKIMEKITFEQSQQLQEDIITHCDGLPQQLIDNLCNIVADYHRKSSIVALIMEYGYIGGAHHKQWLIDQILRIALKDEYEAFIKEFECWDAGIAP